MHDTTSLQLHLAGRQAWGVPKLRFLGQDHQGLPHVRLGQGPRAEYRFAPDAVLGWLTQCASMNSVPAAPKPRIPQDVFEERTYVGRN